MLQLLRVAVRCSRTIKAAAAIPKTTCLSAKRNFFASANSSSFSNLILPKFADSASIQCNQFRSPLMQFQPKSLFHARGSKVQYLDFRHRFKTNHLRLHLLIIRRQKMKKHQRRKWRKKFKGLIEKRRLYREIVKEKAFRVELLSMIREAENFDPKQYVIDKLSEAENAQKELTPLQKFEHVKELVRKYRYQTDYIKPKHVKADV